MPYAAISELELVEFIQPSGALTCWEKSEVLISPPVLLSLKTLANKAERESKNVAENLLENSQAAGGEIRYIELNPRVICFPIKTETLPPATHTNCFVVGRETFVVIDPAAKDESEQAALHRLVDSLIEKNYTCRAIISTHLHSDHTGGETILQTHLREKYNLEIPLAAHELTAKSLAGKVAFQKFIENGETFELADGNGKSFELKTLHTPGHARGLLAFYDAEFGFLLSGDNVVGLGTVVVAPPEGNMKNYLASLAKLRDLPNLRFLCGSHGAAIFDAKGKIESYIAHRLERETQILEAIKSGAKTAREIVERVYTDVSPALFALAEKSVEAHLEKLREEEISRERAPKSME
jgi:glyoxylase-like metal-dependent hydrolase (beta-lactamase superfamily II)